MTQLQAQNFVKIKVDENYSMRIHHQFDPVCKVQDQATSLLSARDTKAEVIMP